VRRLAHETGRARQRPLPDGWRGHGRRVKVVDGATLAMPDTPANQQAYPQHNAQKPGLGFPILRLVSIFCLACGAGLEAALNPYQGKRSGENALLRQMTETLTAGDVLLGDGCFSSYFAVALQRARGVDVVVRSQQCRPVDFRRGRWLGPAAHRVRWQRPKRPAWMAAAPYAQVPEAMAVREVRVRVRQKGFRTQVYVAATTLRDARAYPADDLAELYRVRWQAALPRRSLQVVLGMDVLRCRTPDRVRKEVWVHLLAYNLLRTVLAPAAKEQGLEPWQISFKGTLQTVLAFADTLADATAERLPGLYATLLKAVARHQVGDRPDRREPGKRKRRPKHYPHRTHLREQARAALLKGS
jgi:hypothetical protein